MLSLKNVTTMQPIITTPFPSTWSLDPSHPANPSLVLAVMDFQIKGDSESTVIIVFNMIDQKVDQHLFNQTVTLIIHITKHIS